MNRSPSALDLYDSYKRQLPMGETEVSPGGFESFFNELSPDAQQHCIKHLSFGRAAEIHAIITSNAEGMTYVDPEIITDLQQNSRPREMAA